jgi:hypothetical protein
MLFKKAFGQLGKKCFLLLGVILQLTYIFSGLFKIKRLKFSVVKGIPRFKVVSRSACH